MSKRLEAARRGDVKFMGNPCKRGHDGLRYTQTGACVQCVMAAGKAYNTNMKKLLAEAKK